MTDKPKAPNHRIALMVEGKAITDAPNLRTTGAHHCGNCINFKTVEGDWGDEGAACTKYEFQTNGYWVCDSWEQMVYGSTPMPVTIVEGDKALSGNTLKAISKTDEHLVVGNYLVLFGGRDLTGIGTVDAFGKQLGLTKKNGDGTIGEFFTKGTDFRSSYVDSDMVAVDWEHGDEPETDATLQGPGRDDILGRVNWKSARIDERGLFVERVLNRRNLYVQWIEPLIEAGLVGNSSECVKGGRKVKSTGEIEKWALERDTLTVTPYEPRMLTANALAAIKALHLEGRKAVPKPGAQSPEASKGAAGADAGKPDAKQTETSNDKEHLMPTELEAVNKSIDIVGESVKGIALSVAGLDKRMGDVETTLKAERAGGSGVQVTLDEADRPFKSIADQFVALKDFRKSQGSQQHPRLKGLDALQKATGATEGLGSDGGFLLEPTLAPEILKPMHQEAPFTKTGVVQSLPVGPNSYSGTINGVDETSRATGSRWGGIRGYRVAEGDAFTASRPKFRQLNWKLKKFGVLVYATDELLTDKTQYTEIVKQGGGEELAFMVNDDILNGQGNAGPLGLLNSGAYVSVAKESGQAAATILQANISKMWARLDSRSKSNAIWFINTDTNPQLDALFVPAGVAGLEPRVISYDANGTMRIKGRPVVETEFNASLGTVGDIVLADMSQYLFWEKGGVQEAQSIHVAFTTDETVIRLLWRCDGMPNIASPLTPYKGTGNTVSPFVVLATRS